MLKAAIFAGKHLNENKLFDLSNPTFNRDNCLHPFSMLKEILAQKGVSLNTIDITPAQDADVVIYCDMPQVLPELAHIHKSICLLFESPLIYPGNYDLNKHSKFRYIFTWRDDLVDNLKYFKFNFAQSNPLIPSKTPFSSKKLACIIAGNNTKYHPNELYSERRKVIRWYEKSHPSDFDLYGTRWDSFQFQGPRVVRVLNRVKWLTRLLADKFPSYKGTVSSKNQTLAKYKFCYCYENAQGYPGYITEKIFDCLFAGCVPIYWGAPNIAQHLPSECYIDRRDFNSQESCHNYISTMTKEEHNAICIKIENYLSTQFLQSSFESSQFASLLASMIVEITHRDTKKP